VPVRFQLVIDYADPDWLARFWAAALGYELAPPPTGFPTCATSSTSTDPGSASNGGLVITPALASSQELPGDRAAPRSRLAVALAGGAYRGWVITAVPRQVPSGRRSGRAAGSALWREAAGDVRAVY
jgi:hypothetical protein